MLFLDEPLLDLAFQSVQHHKSGSFFPEPPEQQLIAQNWPAIRLELSKIDLDVYAGYQPCEMFAPKGRLNLRRVAQLHPYDLIVYTALVLKLRDGITANRIPATDDAVFSYRAEGAAAQLLYNREPNYTRFKEKLKEIAPSQTFFWIHRHRRLLFSPIYQHGLKNALLSVSSQDKVDYIRSWKNYFFASRKKPATAFRLALFRRECLPRHY